MPIEIKNVNTEDDVRRYISKIEYLRKEVPDEGEKALESLNKALESKRIFHYLVPSPKTDEILSTLITSNSAMLKCKKIVRRLATEKDSVLIIGESGTGKDILARALHGNRWGKFIAINCAGMPHELIESELFGYVQGAFTGAVGMKEGLFQAAHGGTLFLDEIGDLPMAAQSKLLRVLQDKKIRKVGGTDDVIVDIKIVCATHHNLEEQVEKGLFRLDLYSRINTFPLITVPIRNRKEDIQQIVMTLSPAKGARIYEILSSIHKEYYYPSNVRDIQRFVRQYEVLGEIL